MIIAKPFIVFPSHSTFKSSIFKFGFKEDKKEHIF